MKIQAAFIFAAYTILFSGLIITPSFAEENIDLANKWAKKINSQLLENPNYIVNANDIRNGISLYISLPDNTMAKERVLGILRGSPYILRLQIGIDDFMVKAANEVDFSKLLFLIFNLATPDGVSEMNFDKEMLGDISRFNNPQERNSVSLAWQKWFKERIGEGTHLDD